MSPEFVYSFKAGICYLVIKGPANFSTLASLMPNITPHVCRHTYCSNQAKAGMNPKTLQYLMGHSEIGVTLDVYTHLGLEDAAAELHRMEEVQNARQEMNRTKDEAV